MINQMFDLNVRMVWTGASGKASPKGLAGLAEAMKNEIETGNIARIEDANKAGSYEGIGWRLDVLPLTAKSAIFRSFVITSPEAFREQTGVSLFDIEGLVINQERPATDVPVVAEVETEPAE